jgi:hypothetical protein
MLYHKLERQLLEQIETGACEESIIELLLPSGKALNFESYVFDYKLNFHLGRDGGTNTECELCEIIKDIAAFHNSFGGYLLLGFRSDKANYELEPWIKNTETLVAKIAKYTSNPIPVRTVEKLQKIDGHNFRTYLLFVPKRRPHTKPVYFANSSPASPDANGKKQKFAFRKGLIYARIEHECKPVNDEPPLLDFVYSHRAADGASLALIGDDDLENNLPPRDPNLIRFIGRKDYLNALWRWLSERRNPIKVLTALGGIGKTTVAYEFATQLLSKPGTGIDKVVWLSGKKITFSAIQGKLVPTTRCDFQDIDTFLDAALQQVGYGPEDMSQCIDRDDKIDLAVEAFTQFGILLIVDDVDSLPPEDQSDLFAVVTRIIYSASPKNDASRSLFTSRLELNTGADQKIMMAGFTDDEFSEYLEMNLSEFSIDEKIKIKIIQGKNRIKDASAGSPIFITSIIRLVTLGYSFTDSINQWKKHKGEDVREFAFQKEIDHLHDKERQILYALQLLSRASVDEIREICSISRSQIDIHLSKLKEYHLYSTRSDPIIGAVLEAPEPIRLMHAVTANKIASATRSNIERQCALINKTKEDPTRKVGIIVSRVIQLWRDKQHELAEQFLGERMKEHPDSGELYCLRGRTRVQMRPRKLNEAEFDFMEAEKLGCQRFELVKYWVITKIRRRDWHGIIDITDRVDAAKDIGILEVCRMYAYSAIGDNEFDKGYYDEAVKYYESAIAWGAEKIRTQALRSNYVDARSIMIYSARRCIDSLERKYQKDRYLGRAIFDFVMKCIDQDVGSTQLTAHGLASLNEWLAAEFGTKSPDAAERRRLQGDLAKVRKYVAERSGRLQLAGEIERISRKLTT